MHPSMTLIRTIDDIDIQGKRVIVRADFNVPVRGGVILDSSRIDRFLPTLSELMEHQAIPIIIAHFGRPKGIPRSDLSLQIVKAYLEENLGDCPITFLTDLREESV
jgi:phosphoglycerate kinase